MPADKQRETAPKAETLATRPPQVDKVLRHPLLEAEQKHIRREFLAELTRRELAALRQTGQSVQPSSNPEAQADEATGKVRPDSYQPTTKPKKEEPQPKVEARENAGAHDLDRIAERVVARARQLRRGGIRRVINGTGVILNTNLGRAPLATDVVERLAQVLPGYCSLEIDLPSGKRGERTQVFEELLSLLIGCESAIIVNNNAAAVMLAVSALSRDKEVIVSRGELIEIGGSFRLPDVILSAGGKLREIGTTNRTRASDYEKAIDQSTGLMLRCHRSNFEITGFTEQPELEELVAVSRRHGIPLIEDLGSGALIAMGELGLRDEPTVSSVIKTGADLVLFSGDKLLGGVQSGVIAGKEELVHRLRKHPIYRALRADKLIIATLEAVLTQYLAPEPQNAVPALRMATATPESLRLRAESFVERHQFKSLHCKSVRTTATFGGGTLPGETLESFGMQIVASEGITTDKLAARLRNAEVAVVPIVKDGKVIIDFRTVQPDEEQQLSLILAEVDRSL